MSFLILKRAKVSRPFGQWRDDDYEVICEGAVVGRVSCRRPRRKIGTGCGRLPTATTKTAHRRTATSRREGRDGGVRHGGASSPNEAYVVGLVNLCLQDDGVTRYLAHSG